MGTKRVVVTGYGGICALGENATDIWQSIIDYRVGYRHHRFDDLSIKARYFGFIDPSRSRYAKFSKTILRMVPEFAKYALVASHEALDMAFGPDADLATMTSPFDMGVIIGTGWGGVDAVNRNNNDYQACGVSSSFATLMSMSSVGTAAVSINWNLRGYQNTPVAACATGTMAIGDAYEVIKSGRAKLMLAGGSESLKEQFNVWSIDIIQALTKENDSLRRACCPFSADRSGFVLSEGAAVLCLEEMDHAIARGATIIAEITGYANYSDATDMTAPADDLEARRRAIVDALAASGRHPGQLHYINAHGTSTPKNDINETLSLKAALGDAAYSIPISSTKSYTGHLIGAAGAMESIFCLKTIETGTIPATIHLDSPDPECDLNYTPNHHLEGQHIDAAMNLSFGFGGTNCALVFARVDQPH